jgi:hypothetical protein
MTITLFARDGCAIELAAADGSPIIEVRQSYWASREALALVVERVLACEGPDPFAGDTDLVMRDVRAVLDASIAA